MKAKLLAFSLVEMLLVIALSLMLLALLVPVVNSARESGRAMMCLSNMRQIGMGLNEYAKDNNGYFPPPNTDASERPAPTASGIWSSSIWEYVGYRFETLQAGENDATRLSRVDNVFSCPTTRSERFMVPNGDAALDNNRCYTMNAMPQWFFYSMTIGTLPASGMPDPKTMNAGRQVPMNRVVINQPSSTALLLEGTQLQTTPEHFFKTGIAGSGTGLIPHRSSSNVLFFDLHAEVVKFSTLEQQFPSVASPYDTLDPFWSGR